MSLRILIYFILVLNYVYGKQQRIIGGFRAQRNHFPYQAVLKRIADDTIIGGGAIISHYHILTAAHVVDERSISHTNLKINLGGFNHTHQFTAEYLPSRIYIHPQFMRCIYMTKSHRHDIAVIKINGEIHFNSFQNMIPLPTSNIRYDKSATISGWGTVAFPTISFPLRLQVINVPILNNYYCQTSFPFMINENQFCSFLSKGVGPCTGDSGSPLVQDGILIGIYSLSFLCAYGVPDVYTNVYEYKTFILSVMQS